MHANEDSTLDLPAPAATVRDTRDGARHAALLASYTAAVFASAFLLFLVQPMFGKMALPLLGGSPSVWNTCMLFFQVALLCGYLYAHLTSRWLSERRQWALHLLLLGGALLTLPISLSGAAPTSGDAPIPWLLGLMVAAVGLPFVVLAATGPMLQRWFARTGHPTAGEPYHLYAASNLGSMLALLAYPLLLEPRLRVAGQTGAWTWGFVLLGLLIAGCGAWGWRGAGARAGATFSAEEGVEEPVEEAAPLSVPDRLKWIGFAFVPSSLLLGVTTYITTDLTPAPLFWVLPLAIYLLTFTLAFSRRQLLGHASLLMVQPAIIAAVVIVLQKTEHIGKPGLSIPLHLLGLFITAMVCHGELSRRRPAVRHLTEFYLWIAVGGALGGVFNVLVAPLLFDGSWEYPLMLVVACLFRPWPKGPVPVRTQLMWGARALALGAVLVMLTNPSADEMPTYLFASLAAAAIYLMRMTLTNAPLWLAVCIGGAVAARYVDSINDPRRIYAERSFFGQYRVNRGLGMTVLQHGSTLHGAQSQDPLKRREPLTYYLRLGPLGDVFATTGVSSVPRRVAVVGLGTGTAAAYANEGEDWTFYELDPGIERIARDTSYFTYLADSPAPVRVVLGDARISLQREEDRVYDLIVLDAFSSDAIPTHLLTREAMAIYLARLAPGGRIAIHISNRYLDLEPVVGALARDHGLVAYIRSGPPGASDGFYENSSTWITVARAETDLAMLSQLDGWFRVPPPAGFRTWSDDFSSLWTVMKW